jgi:16S rRNA (cytosine1402-N4)-methyltransferase
MAIHISVLKNEVLKYLDPKSNENFIDCTIGEGGHTLAILEKNGPKGRVLGIDQDPEQIKNLELKIRNQKLRKRLILIHDNFVNLKEIVKKKKFGKVQGILMDLGISSWHLEKSGRGFSFLRNESLDMRFNPETSLTAEKILNYYSLQEIEKILSEYGEERFSLNIAKNIINSRKLKPIRTTFQLVEIIKESIPKRFQHQKINPATRTFQALRIAVNDELNNLQKALIQTLDILKQNGRLVVISFHSLEDRIVKNFSKERKKENLLKILTKKPITPTIEEIKKNNRSRSAKLRVITKI